MIIFQAREKLAQFSCNNETPRLCQCFFGEPASKKSGGGSARSKRGLGVVRSMADHNGLPGRHPQLSERQSHEPRIRFAMFDVIAARH
jgi:hypothetical protein